MKWKQDWVVPIFLALLVSPGVFGCFLIAATPLAWVANLLWDFGDQGPDWTPVFIIMWTILVAISGVLAGALRPHLERINAPTATTKPWPLDP